MTAKKITKNDVNEELINTKLSLADYDEPDLLIRSGGEKRLSNYLLWQIAYTELYFTNTLWPDFNKNDFKKISVIFEKYVSKKSNF